MEWLMAIEGRYRVFLPDGYQPATVREVAERIMGYVPTGREGSVQWN